MLWSQAGQLHVKRLSRQPCLPERHHAAIGQDEAFQVPASGAHSPGNGRLDHPDAVLAQQLPLL